MSDVENQIQNYIGKKPELFYRYADDIFMILHGNQKGIQSFAKFMNNIEPCIKFTIEIQNNNKLPFLDVMIERTERLILLRMSIRSQQTHNYI